MCREEATKLWQRNPELEAAGIRLACIVKEVLPEQISQFVPQYWAGEVYHDPDMGFFKALGGGEVRSKGMFSLLSGAVRANNSRASEYLKTNGGDSNLTGEGFIMGGLYVVDRSGSVKYTFVEETFGDHAPLDDVIAAAQAAAAVDQRPAAVEPAPEP